MQSEILCRRPFYMVRLSYADVFGTKRNKFGNVKTTRNGRKFDSIRESEVARDYETLKRAGTIRTIHYQPRIELLPRPNRIVYVADFLITWADGRREYIDVKGVETAVFKIKAKLFRHFYPNETLTIVK